MNIRPFDIEMLARTILGEARGEPINGRRAVARVVVNRAVDRRWPGTIAEVCLQRLQFSCWNEGDPNRAMLLRADEKTPLLLECVATAWEAALDMTPDMTDGANHYFAHGLVTPHWHDPARVTAVIGRHTFLRL